jgi:uncharacterized SAM-binding protein YcdF (DUF218 family)
VQSVGWVRRLLRSVMFVLAAIGMLIVVVTATPLVKWWSRMLAGHWTDSQGDVLIVLGGGAVDGEVLALSSYWRCVYASLAWKQPSTLMER